MFKRVKLSALLCIINWSTVYKNSAWLFARERLAYCRKLQIDLQFFFFSKRFMVREYDYILNLTCRYPAQKLWDIRRVSSAYESRRQERPQIVLNREEDILHLVVENPSSSFIRGCLKWWVHWTPIVEAVDLQFLLQPMKLDTY